MQIANLNWSLTQARVSHLEEKIASIKSQIANFNEIDKQLHQTPDKPISLTDPDARSMATSGRGTGMVGYNVQIAVDTQNHLIVT